MTFQKILVKLSSGATPVSEGRVAVDVRCLLPGNNHSLVNEWNVTILAPKTSAEETIFLSPL